MLLIPLGVAGERGYFALTVLVTLASMLFFAAADPESIVARYAYDPQTFHVGRMLTSVFMHADLGHVLGNLFFFIGFAGSVERRTNSIAYILIFLFIAIAENAIYYLMSRHAEHPLPTIGLSGVVWGFMGLFLCLNPIAKLDCFFFFLVGAKHIEVSNWIFVLGFLALEIIGYHNEPNSMINHVAHLGGFAAGVIARFAAWPWIVFDPHPEPTRPRRAS